VTGAMHRTASFWDRFRLHYARQVVEGAASLQLVCPYCDAVQTETIIGVIGGDVVYRCENTYAGKGCGREFRGPQ